MRNITKKISDLNCKLDTVSTLSEPRENSYIEYRVSKGSSNGGNDGNEVGSEAQQQQRDLVLSSLTADLSKLGEIKTSKTFPSLCRATLETAIAHLEMTARVTTIDYNGVFQDRGGDPVTAELLDVVGEKVPVSVIDRGDGTYDVKFTAHKAATYCLKVRRLLLSVHQSKNPILTF